MDTPLDTLSPGSNAVRAAKDIAFGSVCAASLHRLLVTKACA